MNSTHTDISTRAADPAGADTEAPASDDWMTPEEFDRAFTAAMPRLRRRLLALTGDPHDADDLLQDTYLRLARRAHARRLARQQHAYAYTCVAALNLLRDSWQQASRREVCCERLPDRGWDGGLALREAESAVVDLLRGLSAKEAAAVILVDIEGLSHDTAGDRLGTHRGTVQRNRQRALAKIRAALQAYGPLPDTVSSTKARRDPAQACPDQGDPDQADRHRAAADPTAPAPTTHPARPHHPPTHHPPTHHSPTHHPPAHHPPAHHPPAHHPPAHQEQRKPGDSTCAA
ncbi:RNA polymerase sigma factor [Streptomyces sp. NPDC059894]|uniref:RNA polymerase sigma factor n=1 Tax=unclassified Streptomyces TaxID=2593676 RepID=UPI003652AC04